MIRSNRNHVNRYRGLHAGIDRAIEHLHSTDLTTLPAGRHELEGSDYLLIQEYDTLPESTLRFETHRRYIDLQILISGRESFRICDASELQEVEAYCEERDIAFYCRSKSACACLNVSVSACRDRVDLLPDELVILFTEDAHMPCVATDEPEPVRKAVYKIFL